jgi:hypothetical protein
MPIGPRASQSSSVVLRSPRAPRRPFMQLHRHHSLGIPGPSTGTRVANSCMRTQAKGEARIEIARERERERERDAHDEPSIIKSGSRATIYARVSGTAMFHHDNQSVAQGTQHLPFGP